MSERATPSPKRVALSKGKHPRYVHTLTYPVFPAKIAAACTFFVNVSKCQHNAGTKRIATFSGAWTARQVFEEYHPAPEKTSKVECLGRIGGHGTSGCGEGGIGIDWATPLADLKALGVTALSFVCTGSATETPSTSKAAKDAFDILLSSNRTRKLPAVKTRR